MLFGSKWLHHHKTTRGVWEVGTVLWNQQQTEEEEEEMNSALDRDGSMQITIALLLQWSVYNEGILFHKEKQWGLQFTAGKGIWLGKAQ